MVVVDGLDSVKTIVEVDKRISRMPNAEEITEYLVKQGEGELIMPDMVFAYPSGHKRKGFYMDKTLKTNIDNYFVPAVHAKWDGVCLITGMEGSSKSTNAMSIAKYIDPSFPGELIKEGSTKRKCDRIVFTPQQFMEAIDNAKPRQCIVWDEAILGFMAADASSEIQKILIKKMVTIRKLNLFIFIVLPSIFLLRRYMAVFRTRFLIHFYSPDGVSRGFFKFYNYDTKRALYFKGLKNFDQDAVPPNFKGRATDTAGLFFDDKEYEGKKDDAIRAITEEPQKKKQEEKLSDYKMRGQRDLALFWIYQYLKGEKGEKFNVPKFREWLTELFGEHMEFSNPTMHGMLENAMAYKSKPLEAFGQIKDQFVEQMKKKMGDEP